MERKQTLRPDGELRYDGPGGPFRAFVEVDRANESATQLAGKIKQYYDYRTVSHDDHFSVLFVTPGPKRGGGPLTAARVVSHTRHVPPLDVYAITAGALSPEGPWAPVWWDADGTRRPLLPQDHQERPHGDLRR